MKLTLVTFGLLYAVAVSGMYAFQRDLQYFPTRRDPAPQTLGLSAVERVALPTPDGETLVLWLSPAQTGRPTILFLHGNAGEIADRADRFAFYQARGYGVAFLSWRGYGGSSGAPSETGLLADAKAAYDHLRARGVPADRIVLVGELLGTGPAVITAAANPVGAVVLEAPYSAAVDIARAAWPWLPVGLLMKDQYRSRDHVAAIRAPSSSCMARPTGSFHRASAAASSTPRATPRPSSPLVPWATKRSSPPTPGTPRPTSSTA